MWTRDLSPRLEGMVTPRQETTLVSCHGSRQPGIAVGQVLGGMRPSMLTLPIDLVGMHGLRKQFRGTCSLLDDDSVLWLNQCSGLHCS